MKTLNNEETRLVENALGNSVVVHSAAIVRVYLAVEGKWEKQTMGAAAIITDRNVNSHFLKVVELGSRKVCFTQELYNNFEYVCPKNFFHTFETDDSVAGFSFADDSEANEFYTKVTECRSTPPQRMINQALAPPISSRPISPPPSSPSTYRHTTSFESSPNSSSPTSLTSSYSGKSSKKKKGGFLSGIFGKEEEEELVVSEPSNFRHVSSIGWNPSEASFEIRNIPPEWKKLFQAAGIKKSELKNKDTAAFVMNIIEQNTGADLRTPGATKVPPPPPGGPRAPPPPPGGPRGGAPPPPPPGGPRGGAPPPPPPGGPRGGAPPPPPPPGSRPPPTQTYEDTSSSSSAPPPPPPPPGNSSGGGEAPRNALLDQIRNGKTLRRVDDEPKDNGGNSNGGGNGGGLAETLARAMAERRAHIREDVKQEEEWSDGEWSDNE